MITFMYLKYNVIIYHSIHRKYFYPYNINDIIFLPDRVITGFKIQNLIKHFGLFNRHAQRIGGGSTV